MSLSVLAKIQMENVWVWVCVCVRGTAGPNPREAHMMDARRSHPNCQRKCLHPKNERQRSSRMCFRLCHQNKALIWRDELWVWWRFLRSHRDKMCLIWGCFLFYVLTQLKWSQDDLCCPLSSPTLGQFSSNFPCLSAAHMLYFTHSWRRCTIFSCVLEIWTWLSDSFMPSVLAHFQLL